MAFYKTKLCKRNAKGVQTQKCSFMVAIWRRITGGEIKTLEGVHTISENSYVIKGEFYPCKPDIFYLTYEPVKD